MGLMFWFKKPKIVIDCFTNSETIITTSPIDFAIKYAPDWWLNLPNSFEMDGTFWPSPTMKGCTGFTEYYRKSIAIPLWCDLALAVKDNELYWQFADQSTNSINHPPQQYGNFWPTDEYRHLKIDTPWIFRTKENIDWVWTSPSYNMKDLDKFTILPGITNFSYVGTPNINMMFNLKNERKLILPVNHVLVHLTPMTERKIEIKRHLLDSKEYEKMNNDIHPKISFSGVYGKTKKLKEKHKKCPFSS